MSNATAPPVTITEFLKARLGEDIEGIRQLIKAEVPTRWSVSRGDVFGEHGAFVQRRVAEIDSVNLGPAGEQLAGEHIAKYDPWRMLAEAEAKQAVVTYSAYGGEGNDAHMVHEEILHLLARPYASHPDYREEWAV